MRVDAKSLGSSPPHRPRIALYAHDGTGIGHAVRACTLARAVRRLAPDAEIEVVTGVACAPAFLEPEIALVSLPPQERVPSDGPKVPEAQQRRRELTKIRRAMIRREMRRFSPDVFLVDHLPLGSREELDETVEMLRGSCRFYLGYRRIAEDVAATRDVFGYRPFREALTSAFSGVLVHAPEAIRERLGELPDIPAPQTYTGFVCRERLCGTKAARRMFGLPPAARVIACSLGGGRGAEPLARSILSAWRGRSRRSGVLLLFAGAHLDPSNEELATARDSRDVHIVHNSPHQPTGIAASDAVVCTGGYNSVLESLSQGKPVWIIPNQRQELEQANSARLLESMGVARCLPQGSDLEDKLKELFGKLTSSAGAPKGWPRLPTEWFGGTVKTAQILLEACGSPAATAQ